MKCFLLMIALYGAFSSALPLVQETDQVSEEDMEFAKKYMENYYPEVESTPVLRSKGTVTAEKIQEMQKFFGLKVTGKLDPNTLEAMKKPRCGVPDIGEYRTFPMSPKWGKKDLTYSIQNYTPDLAPADVDSAIERAWKMWSDVTPLTFTRVYDNSADIEISFASGYHGDYIPFDGQGGQLAHAYSPAYGGNAHFDEDELWTKSSTGTNLFIVAAHEFGHSLGLQHSNVLEALMFPTYQAGDPQKIRLHRDDIEGIQHLYGPPEEENEESEDPTLVNDPMLADSCDPHLAFDAVVSLRGETIFFKNRYEKAKNAMEKDYPRKIIADFYEVGPAVDAAFLHNGRIYLFRGSKQYEYDSRTKQFLGIKKSNSWLGC
ncbi:hypothetical protein JD844_033338 [Phrynosoma platyrhinos]|uniref:Peptidase metallopeptidase domain-containing protein n=1 Tax=Phrynosoma platyrhinos TaxID=52577 RepID=A0ABQ7T667_PHRPL|nr:hypothetical protein JD844_033338 [Phrynosoma platyrhinos]